MQLLKAFQATARIRRFRRELDIHSPDQEVVSDLSLAEVELFFMPGVGAPDAPALLTQGQALFVSAGVMTLSATMLYLAIHLSPPLW